MRVIPVTAHLVAPYAVDPKTPSRPATEDVLMMDPPWSASIIAGAAVRMPRNTPVWLIATMRSHSSVVVLTRRADRKMPALFMRMSRRPWRSTVSATTDSHSVSDDTSRCR